MNLWHEVFGYPISADFETPNRSEIQLTSDGRRYLVAIIVPTLFVTERSRMN